MFENERVERNIFRQVACFRFKEMFVIDTDFHIFIATG